VDLSIVIPLLNEEESLPELVNWIYRVVSKKPWTYEVILVDDGSTDSSWQVIQALAEKYDWVRGIKFRRNYGKSAALHVAFKSSKGDVVITMDADLQDSPDEIPELYRLIKEENYDLISGWKKERHDPLSKTIPSKLFNRVTQRITGIKLHDFNCGLKSYKGELVRSIEVYGEMHRYIPAIAKWSGFSKIGEKVVQHQARKYGSTKFGLERFVNGFLDLLSITFVGKFAKRPMHFFGSLGSLFFFVGFLILIYLSVMKILYATYGIADRPLFFFGVLLLIIGSQLFLTGFLAEMIARNAPRRNDYKIEQKI
jgi:glycosyltransferase involved in cell wall biosynthesis